MTDIASMFKKEITQERLEEMANPELKHYWHLETDKFINVVYGYVAKEIDELCGPECSVLEMGSYKGLFLEVLGKQHPYIGIEGSKDAVNYAALRYKDSRNAAFVNMRFEDIESFEPDFPIDVLYFANCLLYFKDECLADFVKICLEVAKPKYFMVCSLRHHVVATLRKNFNCIKQEHLYVDADGMSEAKRNRFVDLYKP